MKNNTIINSVEYIKNFNNNLKNLRYLAINTKGIWFYLIIISIVFSAFFYQLWKKDYLSEKIVLSQKMYIEIIDLRSDVISSALIKSKLDPIRIYEVNLGYTCKPNKKLIGTQIEMDIVVYNRNYNQTQFMEFPQAKQKICL